MPNEALSMDVDIQGTLQRPIWDSKLEILSKEIDSDDLQQRYWAVKSLRNLVIGSTRQKNMVIQKGLVPKLLCLATEDGCGSELRTEAAVVLASVAKAGRKQVGALVSAGTVQQLLNGLLDSEVKYVEACLLCLRNIFVTDMAPVDLIYQEEAFIPLLQVVHLSNCTRECVAMILSKCCQTECQQSTLSAAGVIDAVTPLLFSPLAQVELAALRCLATVCYANLATSALVHNAMVEGMSVLERIMELMRRDRPMEMQVAAAKCVAYFTRAGVIEPDSKVVTDVAMPALVRGCREDSVLCRTDVRVDACDTLAYLTEKDTSLQRLTAANNQCLITLSRCLLYSAGQHRDKALDYLRGKEIDLRLELEQNALSAFASLCLTDEDIRRKVTMEHPQVMDCATRYLIREEADPKLLLAAARCVHSVSRSVEQLRTTFQDKAIWKPLIKMSQSEDEELAAVGSACIANLCLDFSPCRENIIEADGVEVLCALTRREEESLRLNGIWGLMNLAFGSNSELKSGIMKSLGTDEVLRILTESSPESPVVIRLLALIRNCLAEHGELHIDRLMRTYGNHIIQTVVLVLEGEYPTEAKQLALTILSNAAAGDCAKESLIANEDILRKIANYMVSSSNQLQVTAAVCVSNLVWKDESGALERQLKLKELGVYKILQQLQNTSSPVLFDRVKQALQQFG